MPRAGESARSPILFSRAPLRNVIAGERILRALRRERRHALIEWSVMAVVYFISAIVFTLAAHLLVSFFTSAFLSLVSPPRAGATFPMFFTPQALSVAFIVILVVIQRHTLLADEFDLRRAMDFRVFGRRGLHDDPLTVFTGIPYVLLTGIRSAVLMLRALALCVRIARADVRQFLGPVQVALHRGRKVRQDHLPGVDLPALLREAAWLRVIIPLYAPPIGFTLAPDFRAEIGPTVIEEEDAAPQIENGKSDLDEELQWAFSMLELTPDATVEDVRNAYRQLAKVHHPDVRQSSAASDRMRDLNLAREIFDRYIRSR